MVPFVVVVDVIHGIIVLRCIRNGGAAGKDQNRQAEKPDS